MEDISSNSKSGLFRDFMDLLESVLFTVFITTLVFTFICRLSEVEGDSMLDTLVDKDRLVISNLFYTPKYKDIVIVNSNYATLFDADSELKQSDGLNKVLVKRVIALPGQEVDFDFNRGKVLVDGVELDETYAREPSWKNPYTNAFTYPITVPEGYVFVMGDNRNNSRDSRNESVGLISNGQILGRALFRIAPLNRFGLLE
jgi:signal peptidase I